MSCVVPRSRALAVVLAVVFSGCAPNEALRQATPTATPATAPKAAADPCPPVATQSTAEQMQAGMKTARDRGFLWRVSKGGRRSYLYGTVHVARQEWRFPGPTLVQAVKDSDVVALELDMLDDNITRRLQAGMAPRDLPPLPADLGQRLRAQIRLACLSEQLLDAMSPDLVAATLVTVSARRDGLDPTYAIDAIYSSMARGLMKSIVSLETPEMQLGILQGKTQEAVVASVSEVLTELEGDKARPMMLRMAGVWADSRLGELSRYEAWCDCLNTEHQRTMHRRLMDDRNPALARRIDALHAGGQRVFAALGSLHMVGPRGLPALLAQRGYRVERVEFKP